MIYKEGKGALVTPISTKRLREYANIFRTSLKPKTEKFPVLLFLEIILPQLFDNFSFHPVGKEKMGQNHGLCPLLPIVQNEYYHFVLASVLYLGK